MQNEPTSGGPPESLGAPQEKPAAGPMGPVPVTRQSGRAFALPVWLQIFSWFFLNLLLVAAVAYTLITAQGGPFLSVMINGKSGERLDAIAADVSERINGLPKEKWGEILESYSRRYKMAFALTRRDGDLQAGKVPPLPETVAAKIREFPGPRPPHPPRPGGMGDDGRPSPGADPRSNPEPGPPNAGQNPDPLPLSSFRFIVHENGLYWIGVRVPASREAGRFRGPTTLLLVSSSLLASGVLWDTTPVWVVVAVLLGSALFWLPLVRRITSPLRQMRDAAELMARGEFDTRLALERGDEIGSLATSLNHLGVRLEEFVSGQKRFLGDIAHELGSPLARMQFGLSILEQKANTEMQPLLEDVREEVAQMAALLDEILQFTRAGLQSEVHFENVPLRPLAQKALHQEGISADMVAMGIPEGLSVHADPHFLQRAMANILRNAIRYAGNAGPIRLDARRSGSRVLLSIADSGPGVPPELVHRLCDPFFRTESARTRETGGVGLGLAIVKRCVEACGGSITIRNAVPHGLLVELALTPTSA